MDLDRVLVLQAGVVTLAQARACGLSADSVRRRVRAGAWRELHPCVFLVGGHRLTREARIRASWLWARPARAVVSGPSAAFWYGMLDAAPAAVDLTLPRAMHRSRRPGIVLHRRDLPAPDVTEHRGLAVVAPSLAALETAIALPRGSVFLDRALQRHVRFPAVYRSYCRRVGGSGSAEMHRMLVAAADRSDSAAERLLVRLLRAAGIGGWVLGHSFGPYCIDLAFPSSVSRSRWTAGRGTSTRSASARIGARAMPLPGAGGTCCGSRGMPSTASPQPASRRSRRPSPRPVAARHDQRVRLQNRTRAVLQPHPPIMPATPPP